MSEHPTDAVRTPPPAAAYREIPGFPGYRAGSDGSVWSRWKKQGGRRPRLLSDDWQRLPVKAVSPGRRMNRYPRICLFLPDGSPRQLRVHALVLMAFVGPRPYGLQGCHEDGDVNNNAISNLRWGTPVSNHADKKRHGTGNQGEGNSQHKITVAEVAELRRLAAAGVKRSTLQHRFGLSKGQVGKIINGNAWPDVECPPPKRHLSRPSL